MSHDISDKAVVPVQKIASSPIGTSYLSARFSSFDLSTRSLFILKNDVKPAVCGRYHQRNLVADLSVRLLSTVFHKLKASRPTSFGKFDGRLDIQSTFPGSRFSVCFGCGGVIRLISNSGEGPFGGSSSHTAENAPHGVSGAVLEFCLLSVLAESSASNANFHIGFRCHLVGLCDHYYGGLWRPGIPSPMPAGSWASFVMTAGVGLFGTLSGFLANLFLVIRPRRRKQKKRLTRRTATTRGQDC